MELCCIHYYIADHIIVWISCCAVSRPGMQGSQLYRSGHPLQQTATLSHLENQLGSCVLLKSGSEYHFWLLTYVRYLVQEGQF